MIYTVTTIHQIHTCDHGTRCVGYFTSLNQADAIITSNGSNIYECGYYPFCVIEEIVPGLYAHVSNEWWYRWIGDSYQPISKPESLKYTINFAMG